MQQDALSLLRTKNEKFWKNSSFFVFDVPNEKTPFEERIKVLKSLPKNDFLKAVEFVKCENKEHLQQFFKSVMEKGGEGIMLREPGSLYVPKRSTTLCKYKVSHFCKDCNNLKF
jgi:DNA ligase-1